MGQPFQAGFYLLQLIEFGNGLIRLALLHQFAGMAELGVRRGVCWRRGHTLRGAHESERAQKEKCKKRFHGLQKLNHKLPEMRNR